MVSADITDTHGGPAAPGLAPGDPTAAGLQFLASWAAAWGDLSFAIARGRDDGFSAAGRTLAVVGGLITRLGEVSSLFTYVPAADHLAALVGDGRLGAAPRRAAHLLHSAGRHPPGLLALLLAETDATPDLRLAFDWLPRFRDRMLRMPAGLLIPPGVCAVAPATGTAHDPFVGCGGRIVDTAFYGWRTPRGPVPRLSGAGGHSEPDRAAVAAEFGRFAAAVEWFTEYLLGDPRWTIGGVESLAEAAIGHWQEARLLADRHGVAAPHPAAVGSAAEFHAAMCVLRQWGAASAVAFTRPPAASEGSTEPSTVYAGLAPRCGGRLHCSADFARVRAGGETYRLTPNQRAVIGHMVRRTEAGQPDFSNGELLKECESQADHVRDVFRASGKTSLAWGRLIVSRRDAGRGWYGLALG